MNATTHSFYEAGARRRIEHLFDAGSFREILPPPERVSSPHLAALGVPAAFDDGVVIGTATLEDRLVYLAAQEGAFIGGSVGEVHGAKITGLLERARRDKPAGVLLLLESGGVRLHEANAGLIAVGGILRALLAARAAGVRVLALIGGPFGCFGGCGIVARCCDMVIMSEEGRLGLSGPEVIESGMGVEEFDSRDRPLVWRTTGGKHRFLLGEADAIVPDDIDSFRAAAAEALAEVESRLPLDLPSLEQEQALLAARIAEFGACPDALDLWRKLGISQPERVPLVSIDEFGALLEEISSAPAPEDSAATPPRAVAEKSASEVDPAARLYPLLFSEGEYEITRDGEFLSGHGRVGYEDIAVLGTTDHAAVGVELALRLAEGVLATVRAHPGRPILLLVDTRGQRLSRRDELLGINGYLAHLAKSLEVARQRGHKILALVYSEAVSGGFLSTGLMADEAYALPTAQVRVMALPAMARVTKQPLERLQELSRSSPVFGPGVENYVALRGIRALWPEEKLSVRLAERLVVKTEPASPGEAAPNLPPLTREVIERILAWKPDQPGSPR